MIIGSEVLDDNTLIISYYDAEGKIAYIKKRLADHELFNWVESATATQFRNWDGKYVKKSPTKGRWINQFRIQELINEKLTDHEKELIYSFDHLPKRHYLDIEIKLLDESFPDPEQARMPVGMISFCNENDVTYVLSIMKSETHPNGLSEEDISRMETDVKEYFNKIVPLRPQDKELFTKDFKIKHIFFETEEDLLNFYFQKALPKKSFVTGWNVTEFDWKYLMNRCSNMKVDALSQMASRTTTSRNKIPNHVGILDYMQVFEKLKPYKVVENYKLDYISELVLNANKLSHDYTTMFEFQKDVYLFTMYNVIDVILVKLIEEKLSILDVAFSIANVAQVEVNKVFSPVYIAEILMCREFLNKNLKMMKLENVKREDDATYEGAYVKKPNPGHYRYIACYDFSSMYPNIQIQFNISPDTYLGKIGKVKTTGSEIRTRNQTLFSNKHDSAARTILTRLYDERIKTQSEIKDLKNKKVES